jgi:DNA-binding Lrp family transcriptional regulator
LDRPLRYMAEDLGLSHETFYRILRRLVDEGVVIRTARTLQLSEKKPTRSKANASKSNSLAEVSGD